TLKITSFILVIICCLSTATIGMVSVSAVTYQELELKVIRAEAEKVSGLVGSVPFVGNVCKSLFNYVVNGILPQEKKVDPFKDLDKKLDDIKKTIAGMAVEQKLDKNETFNNLCNTLSNHCTNADEYIKNIQKDKDSYQEYDKELKELQAKAEPTTEDKARINELNKFKGTCTTNIGKNQKELIKILQSNEANSMKNTIADIEKYITDQSIGQDRNPFKNYFEAQSKKLHFTSDALKASQVYESKIMASYINAISIRIRTLIEMCEKSTNPNEAKNLSNEATAIAERSTEVLNKYISIAKEEENAPNIYYDSEGNSTQIDGIGSTEVKSLILYPLGNPSQQEMLRYLSTDIVDYVKDSDKKKYEAFDNYIKRINSMIEKEYTDVNKYTLREFLESKGIEVPKDSKYLIAGRIKWGGFFTNTPVLPTYELDKASKNIVEQYLETKTFVITHYVDCSSLCYFIENKDGSENAVAEVTHNGQTTKYNSFENAMNSATSITQRTKKTAVIKLLKDWNATVKADKTTTFGSGEGFTNGAIHLTSYVTLDLNGHKIDRKLEKAMSDGSVIIQDGGWFTNDGSGSGIIYSSSSIPGLITGGYTTGEGGGVYGKPNIKNCKISGNHAQGNGGGVAAKSHDHCLVTLWNVEITNNKTDKMGGGISTKVFGFNASDVFLYGRVIVKNNCAVGSGGNLSANDCYLEDGSVSKATIRIYNERPLTRDSYIGIISNTKDKWLRITEKGNSSYVNNFFYNYSSNSKYKIVAQGKGNSQYLEIQKN
ncbi:MAG: hypothetical protein PUD24_07440, partial [Oscillospiraceae bacterium]|nr:hypothetical protein [Oscillospiraceae bacterium]